MSWLRSFLRNRFRRRAVEGDLAAEVEGYLELLVTEKIAAGLTPAAARRAARLELGSSDGIKEGVRDIRTGSWLDQLSRDLRFAVRGLRGAPGFALFAVLTFAVAIGGITIIATLVDAALLRPLPYRDSDRLAVVLEARATKLTGGFAVAAPNFLDWERQNRVFEGMALYEYLGFNLSGDGEPEQVGGLRVTSRVFEVLGQRPLLGRGFTAVDDQPGSRVVVLSHRIWQRRFGADSAIVGRSIRVNKVPHTVVGVMPRGFGFPSPDQSIWVPINFNQEDQSRGAHSFWAIARLRAGVSFAEAQGAMRVIGDRLAREHPGPNAGESVNVLRMRDLWVSDAARTLRILMVAVGLMGVIAAANVASLLVARGIARRRELATRMALGGTRARIGRQLATESTLLALLGAAAGLGLATLGIPALVELLPGGLRNLPFRDLTQVGVDLGVFGVVVAIAVLAGLLAGLVPALTVIPASPGEVLKDSDSHGTTARRGRQVRNALVAAEVALSLVVLAGAALLVVSIRRQLEVHPGLDPTNVMVMTVSLPQPDFYGPPTRADFCADLGRRLAEIPGVVAASAVSHVPFSGANASRSFVVEGRPDPGAGNEPFGSYGVVCPRYLETMKIPLLAGRDFTAEDRIGAPPVVIINQALRDKYFPGEAPIGRRIREGRFDTSGPWLTIIGVAGNVHHDGLASEVAGYLYRPYSQTVWPEMAVVFRAAANPDAVIQPARTALAELVPEEPLSPPSPMTEIVDRSLGPARFPMVMFTVFAAVAVLLAGVGIFGVASQSVVQRTRELGVRRAVGASRGHLYRLVLGQVMVPVVIGISAGTAAGFAFAGMLRGILFGIEPTSVPVFVAVGVSLGLVALAATVIPARRAARIDPIVALRQG
jgi:putative ABC transport system permease protein